MGLSEVGGACQPGPAGDRGTLKKVMGAGEVFQPQGETRDSEAFSSPVESWAVERASRHKLERMNSCLLAPLPSDSCHPSNLLRSQRAREPMR